MSHIRHNMHHVVTAMPRLLPYMYISSISISMFAPLVHHTAAGIYTHTPEQLEEAGKYLEEKRAALPGVKIVTELEPIKKYYKAEVRQAREALLTR